MSTEHHIYLGLKTLLTEVSSEGFMNINEHYCVGELHPEIVSSLILYFGA